MPVPKYTEIDFNELLNARQERKRSERQERKRLAREASTSPQAGEIV